MNTSPGSDSVQPIKKSKKRGNNTEILDIKARLSDSYYKNYIDSFVPNTHKRIFYRFTKRCFDIIASLFLLILLSPIMTVIAIAIKCDSKGSVIFKQKRVGKNGKLFNCYKFRSMTTEAPHYCATSQLKDPERYLTGVGRSPVMTSLVS